MMEEAYELYQGGGYSANDELLHRFVEVNEPLLGPMDLGVEPTREMGEILVIGPGVEWTTGGYNDETLLQIQEAGFVTYEQTQQEVATAVPTKDTEPVIPPDYDPGTSLESAWETAVDIAGAFGLTPDGPPEPAIETFFDKADEVKDVLTGAAGKIVDEALDVVVDVVEDVIYDPFVKPIVDTTLIMLMMMMSRNR